MPPQRPRLRRTSETEPPPPPLTSAAAKTWKTKRFGAPDVPVGKAAERALPYSTVWGGRCELLAGVKDPELLGSQATCKSAYGSFGLARVSGWRNAGAAPRRFDTLPAPWDLLATDPKKRTGGGGGLGRKKETVAVPGGTTPAFFMQLPALRKDNSAAALLTSTSSSLGAAPEEEGAAAAGGEAVKAALKTAIVGGPSKKAALRKAVDLEAILGPLEETRSGDCRPPPPSIAGLPSRWRPLGTAASTSILMFPGGALGKGGKSSLAIIGQGKGEEATAPQQTEIPSLCM